jgi:ABC-2 type transport system ATP-binding protein
VQAPYRLPAKLLRAKLAHHAVSHLVLKTQNLSKRFGNLWAVKDLNLELEAGQILGFLGPNGAGKSTTIRMLLRLIKPTYGTIELFGKPLHKQGISVYRRIGALVEKPDFYLYLSARRNLQILGDLAGGVSPDRIEAVLELVKLRDRADDKVKNFSHGMRQRLGIAQAILHDPDLIVLDEPTSGLDPVGIKEIRELIVSLAQEWGKTVFLSSHLLHEVEQTCTHIAIIDRGMLVVKGAAQRLLSESEYFVTDFVVDEPVRASEICNSSPLVKRTEINGNTLKVWISGQERHNLVNLLVTSGVTVHAAIPRTSLEDFYLSLVQSSDL